MAVKITIPVDFQDSAQSYKKIIASLQSELKKVKPGTAIYENISSQLKKANSLILKLEGNIGQGIASHAEIERIIKDFSSLQTVVENVNDAYATMSIKNLNINSENFGNLAKDLVEAASQLAEAKKALSNAENLSIGELFQGDANIGKFTAKQLTSKGKSFYDSLAAQIERLGIKSNEAEQEVKTLEQSLLDLQQQANNLKSNSLAESIAEIVGTAGSKTSKKGQFVSIEEAQTNLLNTTQNKFFTKKGSLKAGVSQDQVEEWLKAFGISDESIAKILETSKDRIERLRQAINAEFTNSKKNQVIAQYRDAAAESIQRQAVEKQIAEVNANLKTARSTANDYSGELKGIQEQFNLLKDKLIRRGILGAAEGEAGDLQKQINAIEQQMASLQSAIVAQGPKAENNLPDTPSREATDQAFNAEREAQQFKDNLKQAISHWLSAQMIITKVREGIHQAWTDIQGLDKAMTNIAVVTDMSVSDLWSKIDQYMAIAQQYGVTTQGVYEVSQLYYQQGLSTNEVMAATTETLKMARIAGMDYADAADAMTVAIRAFKMEMSDAQTITDVYSKVAAVTASDSEELAIAMSKTASSAESVGSSFENTTAMLAVMIETTRESAQNLGSALKSIISRYGEMKTGLTVDSDGEAIDYNKVDTALKSVGISIKDAQGQFRNFDDVIFELSKKWDSLDKNTQRYIATIMAGNRQQSRFIALVDNWERLDEVSQAAYDSEDAGLLQYAKTLDSLETKLNALSTSFQQFYMNIVNGGFFKGIVDILTAALNGLNKLGNWQAILNIANLIISLRTVSSLLLNTFLGPLSEISTQIRGHAEESVNIWADAGYRSGQAYAQNQKAGYEQTIAGQQGTATQPGNTNAGYKSAWKNPKLGKGLTIGASITSLVATSIGSAWAKENQKTGALFSQLGSTAGGAAMGASFGPLGMLAGGIAGAVAGLPAVIKAFDKNTQATNDLTLVQERTEKLNVKRAETKNDYTTLKNSVEKLKELDKTKYNSDENYQSWIEANNQLVEAYPQFIGYIDEAGNTIADLTYSSDILAESFKLAAKANREYYVSKVAEVEKEIELNQDWEYQGVVNNVPQIIKTYQNLSDEEKQNIDLVPGLDDLGTIMTGYSEAFKNFWPSTVNAIKGAFGFTTEVGDLTSFSFVKDTVKEAYSKIKEAKVDPNKLISGSISNFTEDEKDLYEYLFSLGAIKVTEDGTRTYEEHFQAYVENEKKLQELYSTRAAAMQAGVHLASLESATDDTVESFKNWSSFVVSIAQNTEGFDDLDWQELANLDSVHYEELIAPYIDFYNGLTTVEQNLLKDLMGNSSGYSYSEIDSILKDFGFKNGDAIYEAYIQEWTKANYIAEQKIFEGIWGDDPNIKTYGQWIKDDGKDVADKERQETYHKYVIDAIKARDDLNDDLFKILFENGQLTISTDEALKILEFNNSQQEIINAGGSSLAKEAAEARKELLTIIMAEFAKVDFTSNDWRKQATDASGVFNIDFTNWTKEDAQSFISNLSADNAGTTDWQKSMDALAKENGTIIDWSSEALESMLYTSFNTQIQTFVDGSEKFIEDMQNLSEKQAKGFSWKESRNLLNQLGDGSSWDDVFKINEEGIIVLRDFNTTFANIYGSQISDIQALTDEIGKIDLENANADISAEKVYNALNLNEISQAALNDKTYGSEAQAELRADLVKQFGFTESIADSIVGWAAGTTDLTSTAFIDWLKTMGEQGQALIDYLNDQQERIKQQGDYTTYFDSKYKGNQTTKNLISSPSLENLKDYAIQYGKISQDEAGNYDWENYFSSLSGVAIDEFGEMEIIDPESFVRGIVGKTDGQDLNALETKLLHQLLSDRFSQIDSSLKEVESIGADIIAGKPVDFTSIFIKDFERDLFSNIEEYNSFMSDLYERAFISQEEGALDLLKAKMKSEFSLTDEEADFWAKRISTSALSERESAISEYYSLWEKSLTSPLTEVEKLKIKEYKETEWGKNLPDFVNSTFLNYYEKINNYVKNAIKDLPEPEAYNAAKTGANLFIQGKLNEQKGLSPETVYGTDLRGALNEAADSPNQIAESTVSAILAALRIAGVEMEDAYKVFNYNALTETYSFGIRDVNELAIQLFGKSFEELDTEAKGILTNLFNGSQGSLDYNNQKILDFDELQSSINSTLGKIFSNTEELSLSQLEELYKNILGEEAVIDSETFAKWQKIVQQARDGSVESLHTLIMEWLAKLPDGVEVDWNEINSYITTFAMELAQQVAGYISVGLEGSMTSSDLFELSKYLNYTPQQQDYVVSATGIQFTESGALGAATALYKKYGDLSSIGQDLLDTFGGSGGILDSWKSINDYIEEAEKNNKNVNGELDDQISALKQISHLYAISADNADFAFLDQDHFDGQAEGYMKFAESQAKAASILASIKKKERISFDDAQALLGNLDFSKLNIQSLKDGESAITAFWAALTKTMDAAGDVDVGAALKSLGLSFTDVADQINQGTSETAAEMVEYWTSIRDMLVKYRDLDTALQGVEISLPELDFTDQKTWEEIFSGENAEFRATIETAFKGVQDLFNQYKIPVDVAELLDIYISSKNINTEGLTGIEWQKILEGFIPTLNLNEQSWIGIADGKDFYSQYEMSLGVPSKQETVSAGKEAGGDMAKGAQDALNEPGNQPEIMLSTNTAAEQVNLLAQQISEALINSFNEAWTAMTTSSEEESTAPKIPIAADTLEAEETLEKLKQKINDSKGMVTVRAATGNAISTINKLIADINSRTATITVYTKNGGPSGGIENDVDAVSGASGPGKAKGNIALAKGRGTFMGELGPELYVQDGQYHIAGQNGPEFVDLKDDAIVFNHLQTRSILSKGHAFGRGKPLISEHRSVAFATGNIGQTGPAMASGLDAAIATAEAMIGLWQGLMDQSLSDMLKGSGGNKGGGSGNSIKAVTEELQEWYNLSRQIADIEQDINNLLAERENIEWSNGEAYLKSLREQQRLLNKQMATQQALLDYQELQLKRQAQHINQNRIWSQFLTVGEDGLLQYIEGNETNGGKGALQVLQELNQMSGEEQTAYLKRIGYSYTNNDGKTLEGQELVEQFFQELQDQIDQYDSLYDTVHETEETLENLRTEIEDINEQIKENQMDLEEAVFDIIVEAWEKQIEEMEKQADLIKEANEAYINGLNNALSAERQMYDDNQKTTDREQLQRQLSLLRRSGGSASEIADLEEQLNDMLKDEYFSNQERMIEDIQQANDIQVQQLETQIRLQEEALEYQKENGVIWTQVYEVLSKSRDEILAFMQGNSTEFFSQSLLQQEQMLTEWAHKIGIYKEDQKYQNYVSHAQNTLWNNNQAWNIGDMNKYLSTYNTLTDEEKNTIRDQFTSVYANARLDGKDHETAAAEAAAAVSQTLKRKKDANDAQNNTLSTTIPNPQNPNGGDSGNSSNSSGGSSSGGSSNNSNSKVKITVSAGDGHGSPMPQTANISPKTTFTVQPNPDSGYAFDYITYNGTKKYSTSITPTGQVASIDIKVYYKQTSNSSSSNNNNNTTNNSNSNSDPSGHEVANGQGTGWHFHINKDGKAVFKSAAYQTREQATAAAKSKLKEYPGHKYSTKYYMHGGLVDYTGLAMVHGSKTKPESFLNAEQTAQIREGLETTSGKSFALEGIKDTLLKLNSSIQSLTNITNKTESNTYTIAPGAVVIQVEQLNDAYDVDTLSADIMNRMYAIGNKSTNRGVSRR